MIKTFKWLYKLGHDQARNSMLKQIEATQAFHISQAQIASHREDDKYDKPHMSSKEHDIAAKTLYNLLSYLDPEDHPNIDSFLEKIL